MWLAYAFLSAALLGCYDVFKKRALGGNAVIPVLFLNTLFCSLIFLPFVFLSLSGGISPGGIYYAEAGGWAVQKYILLKSCIVLSSWLCGYFGMKHLPLTLVGPINATRPVMVLVGAMLVFGEQLNLYQWIGVLLAIFSFFLLSRSGKKEGIDFRHNRWVALIVLAAILGSISGLYDKFLMAPPENGGLGLLPMTVQSFYNFYQLAMISGICFALWYPSRHRTTAFRWRWSIVCISLFLSMADFAYFYALGQDGAMVSIVSMVRRGSVVVSFLLGAYLFHEKNLRSKATDLLLVLLGLLFLYLGSK